MLDSSKLLHIFLVFLFIILCLVVKHNSIFMNKSLDLWNIVQAISTILLIRRDFQCLGWGKKELHLVTI